MAVDTARRNKRQNKWISENKDRINMLFTKGLKDEIEIPRSINLLD